jgi:hypothetical protein
MRKLQYIYCILALGYLIGIHKGFVALWKTEDPEPVRVFNYPAAMLPEADRSLLDKGIRIDSESELHKLLEDYLS